MINIEVNFKYRIKLIKKAGTMSAHELLIKLQEVLLDSKLPFEWTKSGPHLIVGPAEKQLNIPSDCQYVDIYLTRDVNTQLIEKELSSLNTLGYEIALVEQIPHNLCSVEALAQYVCYEAAPLQLKGEIPEQLFIQVEDKVVNLKPFIQQIKVLKEDKIEIIIELSALRSIGIEQMLMKLPCLEVKSTSLQLKRKALLWKDSSGAFRQI